MKYHYLVKFWYIGTNFYGSQRQPERRTVEGEIISALIKTDYIATPQEHTFKSVARTDKGVHAREAAFSFFSKEIFYPLKINDALPKDIGITAWTHIDKEAKPRYECKNKTYRYYLPRKNWMENKDIIEGLENLCELFQGEHDFTLFSRRDPTKEKETIISLNSIKIQQDAFGLIFEFNAISFLWEQIRRMMNFIIKVGNGEYSLEDAKNFLEPKFILKNLSHKIEPAPPEGLILWETNFPENYNFHEEEGLIERRQHRLKKQVEKSLQKSYIMESILKNR